MAAVTEFRSFLGGAPGLGVDVTGQTIRFKRADDNTQNALFPIPIPSAGLEYSWRKSLKLVVVSAPDNQISNLRFFADPGALGTGRRVLFNTDPVYTQASAADESAAIGATDVQTLTSGSPAIIQPGELVNSGDVFPTDAGAGGSQDFVELQLEVDPTATAGNTGALVLRYRFDET